MKKILFIGGNPWSLINFRGSLIHELQTFGHQIYAISNMPNRLEKKQLKEMRINHQSLYLAVNKTSLVADLNYYLKLRKKIIKIKPDLIIAYTMKPIVYTGLNLLLSSSKIEYFPLITGLGQVFHSIRPREVLTKKILIILLKLSLLSASKILFQNRDNLKSFIKHKIIKNDKNNLIIEGSGVDVNKFQKSKRRNKKNDICVFLLMARLQIDKGVVEYIKAASLVKKKFLNTRFLILGDEDNSNNAISMKLINEYQNKGIIEYFGFVRDVKKYINTADVYVLPSYHEGLPRSILEAMAMEKPILTTNVSGCKETVINGKNGFKIPEKDVNSLYKKIVWFLNNKNKISSMGKKSREIVLKRFSNKIINKKMIELLGMKND